MTKRNPFFLFKGKNSQRQQTVIYNRWKVFYLLHEKNIPSNIRLWNCFDKPEKKKITVFGRVLNIVIAKERCAASVRVIGRGSGIYDASSDCWRVCSLPH